MTPRRVLNLVESILWAVLMVKCLGLPMKLVYLLDHCSVEAIVRVRY